MPFTPFHFGPGLAVKSLAGNYFSFLLFAFTQVVIDLESEFFSLHKKRLFKLNLKGTDRTFDSHISADKPMDSAEPFTSNKTACCLKAGPGKLVKATPFIENTGICQLIIPEFKLVDIRRDLEYQCFRKTAIKYVLRRCLGMVKDKDGYCCRFRPKRSVPQGYPACPDAAWNLL